MSSWNPPRKPRPPGTASPSARRARWPPAASTSPGSYRSADSDPSARQATSIAIDNVATGARLVRPLTWVALEVVELGAAAVLVEDQLPASVAQADPAPALLGREARELRPRGEQRLAFV